MKSSILLLGTGASLGVPVVGCSCDVCHSRTPYNRRTRSCALVKIGMKRFLIDPGTDLRMQALNHHVTHLDGVLFTHAHQDHVGGIDDLRVYHFENKKPLACLASETTYGDVASRFPFMLKHHKQDAPGARLQFQILEKETGTALFEGARLDYFTYLQNTMPVTGFRFGTMAYVTDIKSYDAAIVETLKGVELLILSALRYRPSHMHFTLDDACDFAKAVGAKETYLTHLSHDIDYFTVASSLPPGVKLSFDGLEMDFTAFEPTL